MKALLAGVMLIGLSTSAAAQSKGETWRCKEAGVTEGPILVIASHDGGNTGKIQVAGTTQETSFQVEGFNRRWDFGRSGRAFRFAFVIEPDGSAEYYDFPDSSAAQQRYTCLQDETVSVD